MSISQILHDKFENAIDNGKFGIDSSNRESFNGIFGDRYVAHRTPKFSANFCYTFDTRKTSKTESNGGTVSITDNLLTLQTSTAINGSAIVQTKSALRYSAGRDAEAMFTTIFTTGSENSHQRAGLFDANDGFFVGFEGEEFGLSIRKSTTDIFVPQSLFNKDKIDGNGKSKFKFDPTKMNIFRISYGYLGIAPCFFQIYGGSENGWITFHIHDVVNKQTGTHISEPYLPLRAEVANTGNATNIKMQSGSMYAGVIDGAGAADASSREFSRTLSLIGVTSGTDKPLISFHNKATFSGIANKIEDLLLKVGLAVDGTKTVKITVYKLAVAPIGGAWADVDTINSNMEVNTTATLNLTGAELLDAWVLGKTDSKEFDVKKYNYLLLPNEYAAFTFTSTGTSDVEFVNRWSELL